MVRITDLAHPVFPVEMQSLIDGMSALVPDFPLEREALHRAASQQTGLSDFGDRDYEERFDVLLAAVLDIPHLTAGGRVGFHTQIVQMLMNRLLLTDLLERHPEIHDLDVTAPIIIAGLPRTGTTHLHNLLSADPSLRSLPYWESNEPFPQPGEVGIDARVARTDFGTSIMNQAMPLFPAMHEMTTWHVHEEIQVLANDFSSMLFETLGHVPAWAAYFAAHDQTPHYRYLRTTLKALQQQRGGTRWVLKSPQHLEQLPVLAEVFPDATVVVTHRDPVAVAVSMTTMILYTARMHADPVDVQVISRFWMDRLEQMLTACVRDRSCLPRAMDVRFDDFMTDDLGMVRRICALANHELTPEATKAMQAYVDGHQRNRHGVIDYHAEDLGLDLDDLRQRFAPYVDRFLS